MAAGGSKRYPKRHYYSQPGQVDYAYRAELAQRYGKVPEGKQLTITHPSDDEVQIDLVDGLEEPVVALEPVVVPDRVAKYHPVVRQFKEKSDRHEVSRAVLPRVVRILHGLLTEAERRGYAVEITPSGDDAAHRFAHRKQWVGSQNGHFVIKARDYSGTFRVREEGVPSRRWWEDKNRQYVNGEWRPPSLAEYEADATGRLRIELVHGWGRTKWADRSSSTLEEKLPDLLGQVEQRAIEVDERRAAAEREAAEREVAWKAALQKARERHAEYHRIEVLNSELSQWRQAEEVRTYCDAIEAQYADDEEASEWAMWARRYADSIDPLTAPPRPPSAPKDVSGEDLRPFLDGWDPYSPTRRRW
jgi:hypothetical protein